VAKRFGGTLSVVRFAPLRRPGVAARPPLTPAPTARAGAPPQAAVSVDGERLGRLVASSVARGLSGSPGGGPDFDWSQSYAPAGMPLSIA
jgi:hypothetical protein